MTLEAPIRRASRAKAQGPERPRVTILDPCSSSHRRSKLRMVVEPLHFGIEGMVEKRRVGGGQRPHAHGFFFQDIEQYRRE